MDTLRATGANALAAHRFILRIASASVVAFLWLFIFVYFLRTDAAGGALARTLFLYALSEVIAMLATPAMLRYISGSMLRGLAFGTVFLALAYCYTGALAAGLFPHGAAIIGILLGLSHALYRVSYVMEQNALVRRGPAPLRELTLAAMPAVAGSALALGLPFSSLMFIAALLSLIALSLLPLVPNAQEVFSWSYRETFRRFLHEGNSPLVYRAMLTGAKNVGLIVLWPLALVMLGVRSVGLLGALISAALLVSVAFGSGRGFRALERAMDGGHYVDEYTALKEMGRAFGAAVICCAIAALASLS